MGNNSPNTALTVSVGRDIFNAEQVFEVDVRLDVIYMAYS